MVHRADPKTHVTEKSPPPLQGTSFSHWTTPFLSLINSSFALWNSLLLQKPRVLFYLRPDSLKVKGPPTRDITESFFHPADIWTLGWGGAILCWYWSQGVESDSNEGFLFVCSPLSGNHGAALDIPWMELQSSQMKLGANRAPQGVRTCFLLVVMMVLFLLLFFF